jgi:hypothetical protein
MKAFLIARAFASRAWKEALDWFREIVGAAGIASLSYGAWLAYRPAGLIVLGMLLIALAWLLGRSADE